MDSKFFKPVVKKGSMDEALSPDFGPAGIAPLAAILSILPLPIRSLLRVAVQAVQAVISYIGAAIEQSFRDILKPAKKGEEKFSPPRESYATHASFDHLIRIERLEAEIARHRGGFTNKLLHKQKEHRIQNLEHQLLGHKR